MQESLEKQIQKIKKCNSHCLKSLHANPAYSITKHNIVIFQVYQNFLTPLTWTLQALAENSYQTSEYNVIIFLLTHKRGAREQIL